jgi:AbrB family looped-hinge helix DNA binding protein
MGEWEMGIKLKVDERGRITVPAGIREAIGIKPMGEVTAEKREEGLMIYKQLNPEEFISEARALQAEIKATKVSKEEPLKVKEIWKTRP